MIKKFEDKMQKSIESLEREYNSIRAGRANPHVLDKIKVDYYGTPIGGSTFIPFNRPAKESIILGLPPSLVRPGQQYIKF